MTYNEFKFCCTVFCEYFEGRKYGDIVKQCYTCDEDLPINVINNNYIVEKFTSIMRIGDNMVFWFGNMVFWFGNGLFKVVVIDAPDIIFETIDDFLGYFKIPFEDIV